jgi:3-phenylpropionate/cinnamic acid dioxygenase small subunit
MTADADTRAVMTLLARYAHLLDAGDFAGTAGLWTSDGTLDVFGRTIRGHDALRDFFAGAVTGKHFGGVPAIDLDTDRARVESDYVFFRGDDLSLFSAGRYIDDLVRTDDGWRLSHRTIVIEHRARRP